MGRHVFGRVTLYNPETGIGIAVFAGKDGDGILHYFSGKLACRVEIVGSQIHFANQIIFDDDEDLVGLMIAFENHTHPYRRFINRRWTFANELEELQAKLPDSDSEEL